MKSKNPDTEYIQAEFRDSKIMDSVPYAETITYTIQSSPGQVIEAKEDVSQIINKILSLAEEILRLTKD